MFCSEWGKIRYYSNEIWCRVGEIWSELNRIVLFETNLFQTGFNKHEFRTKCHQNASELIEYVKVTVVIEKNPLKLTKNHLNCDKLVLIWMKFSWTEPSTLLNWPILFSKGLRLFRFAMKAIKILSLNHQNSSFENELSKSVRNYINRLRIIGNRT